MAIEIVDFPINSMVIFHSYVSHYQRVGGRHHRLEDLEGLNSLEWGTLLDPQKKRRWRRFILVLGYMNLHESI